MKSKNEWRQDGEYVALVSDLLEQPAVQKLANYTQHHHSNRLQHSIAVSYDSYRLAKRLSLDYQATAPGWPFVMPKKLRRFPTRKKTLF